MPSGETQAHRTLKHAALFWAQCQGYSIAGLETRVPNSRFRADVAAYRPERGREPGIGATAVFECKQSRPDFLKDRHGLEENLDRLRNLNVRRHQLEHQLGIHFPSLRQGDALFQDFESVNFDHHNHAGYRQLMREIGEVESRIYGKTKFDRMIRWKCANLFYLVAPRELLSPEEVPSDWGILAPPPHWDFMDGEESVPELELLRKPRFQE
ncbi:MAG: hypothetical protein AAGH89_07780 [Verrucomicrobiota bacterium]